MSQANTYRTSHSILLSIERTITHENCLSPLPPTTRHFPPTFVVASLRLREVRSDGRLGSSPFLLPQPFARRCACANKRSVFRIFLLAEICHIFRWQVSHTQTRNTSWTLFFRKLSYGALVPLPLTRRKRKSKKEAKKNFNRIGREEETTRLTTHFYFIFGMAEWLTSKHEQKKKHPRTFGVAAKTKKKDKQETLIAPLLRERKVGFPIFTSSFFSGTTFWHSAILFSTPAYPIPVASQPSNILREEDLFFSKPRARVFGFFFWFGAAESVRPSLRARGYPRSGQHHFFSFENSTSKIVLFSLRDFFLCRVEFKWNDPPTIEQHENVLFSFFFIICPLPTSKRRLFCRLLHMLSLG